MSCYCRFLTNWNASSRGVNLRSRNRDHQNAVLVSRGDVISRRSLGDTPRASVRTLREVSIIILSGRVADGDGIVGQINVETGLCYPWCGNTNLCTVVEMLNTHLTIGEGGCACNGGGTEKIFKDSEEWVGIGVSN